MKKIAVIEDNPDDLLLVATILEEHYQVRCYTSGTEALDAMPEAMPDLILTDVALPGMDGLGLLEKLRSRSEFRNTPIVALTAYAMVGDREKYLHMGFDGYFSKPITDEREFLALVESMLKQG